MKKHLLILMITLCGLNSFSQVPFYIPANGLAGWWPFNGNANDESGNGNNGTPMNGVALTTDRFGSANSAYYFDGINDYIISNSSVSYLSDSISINFWINYNSDFGINDLIAFGDNTGVRWGCEVGATSLRCTVGRGCSGVGNELSFSTSTGWHMVTYVIKRTRQEIYYDSVYLGYKTNSLPSSLSCATTNLWFGVHVFTLSTYYNGKLDDIGIWNRALTPLEIQQIYQGPTGISEHSISNGLIVYPNPVSDELFIIENSTLPENIFVFDALGQKIRTWRTSGSTFFVSIKELSSGIYYIRDDKNTWMSKIIRN